MGEEPAEERGRVVKVPTAATAVHVWEKRRPDKTTARIEVCLADGGFLRRPAFDLRIGWRPYRAHHFRFPSDPLRHRQGKEDERLAIDFAIVTADEIREAIGEFLTKVADLKIPEPVTPPDLRE
jgi:hypothetical protein